MRVFIDSVTRIVAWLNRRQRIKTGSHPLKINLGCGLRVIDGWVNIDVSLNAFFAKWPKFILRAAYGLSGAKQFLSYKEYIGRLRKYTFIHHNLNYGIPFLDESIDYLYLSASLEYLHKAYAVRLLKEAYRTLKKSGIIRICTLDLEYILKLHKNIEKEKALDYFFNTSKDSYFNRLRHIYDFDLLKYSLESVGFTRIYRYSYQQGKTPDIDILDFSRDDMLFIEAQK